MRVEDGIGTVASDEIDSARVVGQVSGVRRCCKLVRDHALHQEWQPEGVESLIDEGLEGLGGRESKVCVVHAGDVLLAKLCARLIDAEELERASALPDGAGGGEAEKSENAQGGEGPHLGGLFL